MADYVTSISTIADLRTWWDSTVPATIGAGDHYIAELAAGTYALNTVGLTWGSKTVNGLLTIRAATAAKLTSPTRPLRGSTADGACMTITGFEVYFEATNLVIEGVQFHSTDVGAVLRFSREATFLKKCIVSGTIVTRWDAQNGGAKDSVFISNLANYTTYTPASNTSFENCTFVSFGAREALTVGAPDTLLKNCVLAALGGADALFIYSGSVASASANNAFNVGATAGSSASTFTAASEFENVSSFAAADLRLKSGSSLATLGASGVGTGADIYWQSRTAPYSLGGYEKDGGGAVDGSATGATLTGSSGISAGSASGNATGSAAGATISGTSSLTAGGASGTASGTATGANLTGTSSISAGAATGNATGSFTTAAMENNSGAGLLASTSVAWTWYEGAIGSAPTSTTHGTGTTNGSGILTVTGLPVAAGFLLARTTDSSGVYYQSGTPA